MNIGNRLHYLMKAHKRPAPDFSDGPILEVEWEQLLFGRLPLIESQAEYLADLWNIPVAYLEDYNEKDLTVFRKLQSLQHELLTNKEQASETIQTLDKPWALASLTQEVIFHLLKSIYLYKNNFKTEAEKIEADYLSYMLPDHNVLTESSAFQKALFYYYGVKYFYEGKQEESFAYFERLLEKTNDEDEVVSIMQNLALITMNNQDYDQAIAYMKRLNEFSLAQKNNRGLSIALNYLGVLHMLKESYPTAIQYFEKMQKLDLDPVTESRMQHNLGVLYYKLNKYQQALQKYRVALQLIEDHDLDEGLFDELHAIAKINFFLKNKEAADCYLEKARQAAGNEDEITLAKLLQAEMLAGENISRAILLYEEVIAYYEALQNKRKLEEIYPVVAELYSEKAKQLKQKHEQLHIDEAASDSKEA
ncbi:Tetratricopeptide repeat-containing protein [Thalassobacillus cyri]|uniref:Tetratricopeptide repeat-containing protein n=1 Tax=Thalassobacillus cyri TaxID=571932 RepID=A0A1H4DVV5_9BACI|nr:tetratricopeptide repeat protein [Thalassobacillus cyri]SEA76520.1 Tetratricopeptide repeat-containing protein [Thalassobacillus cyri]